MKIYTKKGDKGNTTLLDGTRLTKHSDVVEAYGTVDELNSWVGLLVCEWNQPKDKKIKNVLLRVQHTLFTIGSLLSSNNNDDLALKLPEIYPKDIHQLEQSIDEMESTVPPLTSFILPGGDVTIVHIHIARTICRRAERRSIKLEYLRKGNSLIIPYLNRLSDFLFVLARYKTHLLKAEEIIWQS